MDISKSSRHSKIAGDYFELQVLYNLSKYGFECSIIDHIGIDVIAKNPNTNKLWGISVKGRTRTANRVNSTVTFKIDNVEKTENACKAFNCDEVYFAICIDEDNETIIYLLTLNHLLEKYTLSSKKQFNWNMTLKAKEIYEKDSEIKILKFYEHNDK